MDVVQRSTILNIYDELNPIRCVVVVAITGNGQPQQVVYENYIYNALPGIFN